MHRLNIPKIVIFAYMNIKFLLLLIAVIITLTSQLTIAQSNKITTIQNNTGLNELKYSSKSDFTNSFIISAILVLSPTLILEDGKGYFGLSKEFSAGKYPFGRAELDYTYIFRNERSSALHLSYNFDIPLNGNFSDPSLFMLSPGAGYYTDFTRKGFFGQLAIGLFATTGFSDAISIHPNIKFRKVFMKDDFPGAFEISLGVGFGIYSR